MSVPRSPHRRHSPLRGRAVPFAPASVPLVGFAGSVPPACQSIQDEIKGRLADLNDLQFQLQHARAEDRPAIKAKIRELNKKLTALQKQLAECIASHHVPPPIEAFFIGNSTFH
jgi:hypothetical protein